MDDYSKKSWVEEVGEENEGEREMKGGGERELFICLTNLVGVVRNNQSIVEAIKSVRNTSTFLLTEECCNAIISILPHDEIPSLPKP